MYSKAFRFLVNPQTGEELALE